MPVLDGLEATRRIRALEGGDRVKIVAITASVFKSESDRILSAGMNAVVRKPYRSDEIYSCLTDQLGVQFVREDEWQQGSPMDSPPNLRPESLARLPPTLRDPLLSAVLSLDSAQLAELIKEIAALDAELGRALAHHAEQLSYSAIVQALNVSSTCTPKAPP